MKVRRGGWREVDAFEASLISALMRGRRAPSCLIDRHQAFFASFFYKYFSCHYLRETFVNFCFEELFSMSFLFHFFLFLAVSIAL